MSSTFPSQRYRAWSATVRLFAVILVLSVAQCREPSQAFGQGESTEDPPASESSRGFTGLASGLGNTVRGIFGSKDSSGEAAPSTAKSTSKREFGLLKPGAFRNGFAKQIRANTVPDPDADFSLEGAPTKGASESAVDAPTPERIAQGPSREPFSTPKLPPAQSKDNQKLSLDPPSLVGSGVRSKSPSNPTAPAINRFNAAPNKLAELPKPSTDVSRYSQQQFAPQALPEVVTPSQVLNKPARPEANAFLSEKITTDRKAASPVNDFSADPLNRRVENPSTTSRKSVGATTESSTREAMLPPQIDIEDSTAIKAPVSSGVPELETAKSGSEEMLRPVSKKPVPTSTRREPNATAVNAYKNTDTTGSFAKPLVTDSQLPAVQNYGQQTKPALNEGTTNLNRSAPTIGYDLPSSNYSVTTKQTSPASPTTNASRTNSPLGLSNQNANRSGREIAASSSTGTDTGPRLDMSIPKVGLYVAGPSAMQVAKTAPYEVIVKNEGTESLSGVIVSMTIPAGVSASSFVSTAGEFESEKDEQGNDTVLWHVTDLGPTQSRIFKLNLEASKPEHFAMDVEWTVLPQSGQIQIAVEQPQLTLALEGPSEVLWGKPELYRLKVRNPGNAVVKDVHVKLVAESFGSNDSNIGDIPAGGERVVEVELTFQQMGKIAITGNAASKTQSLEAKSNIDVSVNQIKLESEWHAPKQQYLGSVADYELTLHNRSNLSGELFTCLVMIPEGLTAVSIPEGASIVGNEIRWKIASINANESRNFNLAFQANEPTEAKFRFDAQCAGNGATTSVASTSVDPIVDLKLTVVDPVAPAPVGREVQYDLIVLNRGSRPARAVSVIAQFSNGIEPIRAEGVMGKLVPGQVIFDPIDLIGPGQQITLRVVAQASEAGVHRFRAELQCEDGETQLIEEESTRYLATSRSDVTKPTIRR